ncbi:MAG: hypothetical protein ACE365_02410 [Gammaproteobacteria bacterium]
MKMLLIIVALVSLVACTSTTVSPQNATPGKEETCKALRSKIMMHGAYPEDSSAAVETAQQINYEQAYKDECGK